MNVSDCETCHEMANSEYGIEEPHEAHEGNDMTHTADCDITVRAEAYKAYIRSNPTVAETWSDEFEAEAFCTCHVEAPEFDPCTCGCGSMICSNYTLCAGCTDIVLPGDRGQSIAGEEYCWACFAEYEEQRLRDILNVLRDNTNREIY